MMFCIFCAFLWLRCFDDELAAELEVGFLAPLHVLRRRLRKRRDQDRQRDRRVTRYVSRVCSAREFSVDQSFVKRHCIRSSARVRSDSRDLNRVLVSVVMFLLHKRRESRLLNKTLRSSAAEI